MARTSALTRLIALLQAMALAGVFVLLLLLPAVAQSPPRADVVLDGQVLFRISSAGEFTAQERADTINARLQQAVTAADAAPVEVVNRDPYTVLLLGDRPLLTVTDADVLPGNTMREQGRIWARQITTTLQAARRFRTQAYVQQAVLRSLGALAIALVLHWALGQVWQRAIAPAVERRFPSPAPEEGVEATPQLVDTVIGSLLAIARGGVWLGAAFYAANLFPVTRQWSYRVFSVLLASFTSPLLTLGNRSYSVINLLILAGLLGGLIAASKTVTDVLRLRVLKMAGVQRGAQEAIAVLVRYGLIFIGSLVLLQVWGLDISSLAIFASALSVGVGFGLQDIAKNFGSGLVLVFERPIQVGDFVEVGEFQGVVERIGARSTLIRTLDQISIIVPNSRFLEQEVINWSHRNPVSRLHLPVGVAYRSDVERVRSTLLDAARRHPRVLTTPPPQVFFKGFGDSALNFELLVWTSEPSRHLMLKSDLYFQIEASLRQHQIEVPFPQRDLHVQMESLPLELSPELRQTLEAVLQQFAAQSTARSRGEEAPQPDVDSSLDSA